MHYRLELGIPFIPASFGESHSPAARNRDQNHDTSRFSFTVAEIWHRRLQRCVRITQMKFLWRPTVEVRDLNPGRSNNVQTVFGAHPAFCPLSTAGNLFTGRKLVGDWSWPHTSI